MKKAILMFAMFGMISSANAYELCKIVHYDDTSIPNKYIITAEAACTDASIQIVETIEMKAEVYMPKYEFNVELAKLRVAKRLVALGYAQGGTDMNNYYKW